MVRFIAELAYRYDFIVYPTPSNDYPKYNTIYEINIATPPTDSYWLDWGGSYDEFVGTLIDLYYGGFLQRVNSAQELQDTSLSLYIRPDQICLINIPRHPWLYSDYQNEAENVIPFLSACLDPANPSLNIVKGIAAAVRLELPNFNVKLSETISGIVLNQGFSITLHNNDGFFDDEEIWNLFNTPVHLKKAIIENPQYEDFKTIRNGLVENSQTTFDKLQVDVADNFRAMGEPVCNIIQQADFPSVTIDEKNLGKTIPIVYGRKTVKLLKLDDTRFVAAEEVTTLNAVYDKDGNTITGTYDPNTNIITSTTEADSADITGYTNNDIGNIITDIVTRKTSIDYTTANWNTAEVDAYKTIAPSVNFIISSGDVKKAIQSVLKSDMAYFIQQNDGKFTIRKYGNTYALRYIPEWSLTKKPEKTWGTAQESFFSSCIVNYDYVNDDEFSSYLFNENETEAEDTYRRRTLKTFDTDLTTSGDADALARLLSSRYTFMKQTIKIAVGIDTSSFELLDTVTLNTTINNRKFSNATQYIIKEINPAQDTLVLEETESQLDVTGEYPDTVNYMADYDNMYAYTSNDVFAFELEGGGV